MSNPYIESEVIAFVQDIEPLLPDDLGRLAVNAARMQADATGHDDQPPMGYEASRAKHLRELQDEIDPHPHPIPPPVPGSPLRGAFCIPFCEVGDGRNRLWWPSFLGQPEGIQDRMIAETLRRGYNHGEVQISGWPYNRDYPEISLNRTLIRQGLTKMRAAGLQTIIAFRDDQGPDLSYLRDTVESVAELVDWCMCIYEMNGVFRDPKICLDVVKQARQMLPSSKIAVHFTAQDPGTESFGLIDWTRAKAEANLNAYFFQVSGWLPNALLHGQERIADWTRRLMAGFHGYPILSHGVINFEDTTSRTYRNEWTEKQGTDFNDALMNAPLAPDEGVMSVRPAGYGDGGTVSA